MIVYLSVRRNRLINGAHNVMNVLFCLIIVNSSYYEMLENTTIIDDIMNSQMYQCDQTHIQMIATEREEEQINQSGLTAACDEWLFVSCSIVPTECVPTMQLLKVDFLWQNHLKLQRSYKFVIPLNFFLKHVINPDKQPLQSQKHWPGLKSAIQSDLPARVTGATANVSRGIRQSLK